MTSPAFQPGSPASPARRKALYAGVAAVAGLGGAGVAWWKFQPRGQADAAVAGLWSQEFVTPAGAALPMQALQGKPLLINFWATWCPPCVEELPLLDRFYRENTAKSWQVVGLAIDQPSSVRNFLLKTTVTFPVGLAGLGGTELGKALGNQTGVLPFTVVLAANGQVLERKMGKLSPADLAQWVRRA